LGGRGRSKASLGYIVKTLSQPFLQKKIIVTLGSRLRFSFGLLLDAYFSLFSVTITTYLRADNYKEKRLISFTVLEGTRRWLHICQASGEYAMVGTGREADVWRKGGVIGKNRPVLVPGLLSNNSLSPEQILS
jgi:hypothetical protein